VKGEFQGILALREQMDHKYGAADFYIVCVLRPHPTEQKVDVQDTQEITNAQWIPLSEITTNEDGCKYKLFPNAFEFLKLIKQWLAMNGKTVDNGQDKQADDVKVTDLIKMQTLAHRSQVGWNSRENKEMIWNFYMPHNIDRQIQEKL